MALVSQIFLETTNKCSACCSTCLNRVMRRERGVMPQDKFQALVDGIAAKRSCDLVHLYGFGEPYLTPGYLDYCNYAIPRLKGAGIRTAIITNGMLITEIPEGVDSFVISFNAGTRQTYERVTGLDYERTLANIRRLHKEGQFRRAGRVEIHMLVFEDNAAEVEQFRALFSGLGARLRLAFKYDNQRGLIQDKTLPRFKEDSRRPCHYVFNVLNICWDGRVILCPHDADGEVCYGNAFEEPLARIARHRLRRQIMEEHSRGRFGGLCEKCNFNVEMAGKYAYLE
jgi:MoaA/NifB/PqqE/SkfB family radical SAM enzyme